MNSNFVIYTAPSPQIYGKRTPYICKTWITLTAFIISIFIVIWSGISLNNLLTQLKDKPNREVWLWTTILTVWCLLTGLIFVINMIVANLDFDNFLTGYLMFTWVVFTGLCIWKAWSWSTISDPTHIYHEYVVMLITHVVLTNMVYVMSVFFPHASPSRSVPNYSYPYYNLAPMTPNY